MWRGLARCGRIDHDPRGKRDGRGKGKRRKELSRQFPSTVLHASARLAVSHAAHHGGIDVFPRRQVMVTSKQVPLQGEKFQRNPLLQILAAGYAIFWILTAIRPWSRIGWLLENLL